MIFFKKSSKNHRIPFFLAGKTVFMAITIVLGFTVNTVQVFALDPVDYADNDVLFFDPTATPCSSGGSLSGSDVEEKIWNYLIGKGLSAVQAAGVMGNMQAESSFIPTRHQSNRTDDVFNSASGNAWGLVQWDGGRRYTAPDKGILGALRNDQPNLIKYADAQYDYGHYPSAQSLIPASDLDALTLYELNYMYGESQARRVTASGFGNVNNNEWATLKSQTTVQNATLFWDKNFEGSAGDAGRVSFAQAVYDKYSHNAPGAGTTNTTNSDGTSCSATTGDIAATVASYAWPQYHAPDYINAEPAYTAAVKVAQSQGRYVGGGVNPGIDCGGFVTTLMYDSGFDKTYNSNAKGGATPAQQAWVEKNWQTLGKGNAIDTATLHQGDVAFIPGHTFVYVGKGIPNFGSGDTKFTGVASASYGGEGGEAAWRAPMAGHESLIGSDVTWYRKK
jgi:hypothetical protein